MVLRDQKQEQSVVTGKCVGARRGSGSPPPSCLPQITVPSPERTQETGDREEPRSHKEQMTEMDS